MNDLEVPTTLPIMRELLANPDAWKMEADRWGEAMGLDAVLDPRWVRLLWLRFELELDQRLCGMLLAMNQQRVSYLQRRAMEKARRSLTLAGIKKSFRN